MCKGFDTDIKNLDDLSPHRLRHVAGSVFSQRPYLINNARSQFSSFFIFILLGVYGRLTGAVRSPFSSLKLVWHFTSFFQPFQFSRYWFVRVSPKLMIAIKCSWAGLRKKIEIKKLWNRTIIKQFGQVLFSDNLVVNSGRQWSQTDTFKTIVDIPWCTYRVFI